MVLKKIYLFVVQKENHRSLNQFETLYGDLLQQQTNRSLTRLGDDLFNYASSARDSHTEDSFKTETKVKKSKQSQFSKNKLSRYNLKGNMNQSEQDTSPPTFKNSIEQNISNLFSKTPQNRMSVQNVSEKKEQTQMNNLVASENQEGNLQRKDDEDGDDEEDMFTEEELLNEKIYTRPSPNKMKIQLTNTKDITPLNKTSVDDDSFSIGPYSFKHRFEDERTQSIERLSQDKTNNSTSRRDRGILESKIEGDQQGNITTESVPVCLASPQPRSMNKNAEFTDTKEQERKESGDTLELRSKYAETLPELYAEDSERINLISGQQLQKYSSSKHSHRKTLFMESMKNYKISHWGDDEDSHSFLQQVQRSETRSSEINFNGKNTTSHHELNLSLLEQEEYMPLNTFGQNQMNLSQSDQAKEIRGQSSSPFKSVLEIYKSQDNKLKQIINLSAVPDDISEEFAKNNQKKREVLTQPQYDSTDMLEAKLNQFTSVDSAHQADFFMHSLQTGLKNSNNISHGYERKSERIRDRPLKDYSLDRFKNKQTIKSDRKDPYEVIFNLQQDDTLKIVSKNQRNFSC